METAIAAATPARSRAIGEINERYARYDSARRAVEAFAPAAGLVAEAVSLAARGYELGEGDLASVLLVRREAIDAETAMLDAQYAHAAAKLELLINAGRTPR